MQINAVSAMDEALNISLPDVRPQHFILTVTTSREKQFPPPHSSHPRTLLRAYDAPGLFITGTGTDIGKTTVTAALAGALHSLHMRVGICKPVASGCPKFSHRGQRPGHRR